MKTIFYTRVGRGKPARFTFSNNKFPFVSVLSRELFLHTNSKPHRTLLGDCLTSTPKGRLQPRELWFSIYSWIFL